MQCCLSCSPQTLAPFLLNTIGVLSNSSQVTSHLGEADLPPGCVVATVTGQVAVHLPLQGLIDPEKEAARLSSSQARLAAQLDKLRKDAARPDYDEKVRREPQDTVEAPVDFERV